MPRKPQQLSPSSQQLAANKVLALKKKAKPVQGALWVQIGKRKLQLPNMVHLLHDAETAFLSIKPTSQLLRLGTGTKILSQVAESEVADAYKQLLNVGARSRVTKGSAPVLDSETQELIRKLESKLKSQGLKAAVDLRTGELRAAKPRAKRK